MAAKRRPFKHCNVLQVELVTEGLELLIRQRLHTDGASVVECRDIHNLIEDAKLEIRRQTSEEEKFQGIPISKTTADVIKDENGNVIASRYEKV